MQLSGEYAPKARAVVAFEFISGLGSAAPGPLSQQLG